MEKQIESVYVPTEGPMPNELKVSDGCSVIEQKLYLYTLEEHAAAQQALSKAEDKGECCGRCIGYCYLDNEGKSIELTSLVPREPTNSLDELERWVNRIWADGKMIIYPKDDLLAKIQKLKTITPNNGWISVEDRFPESGQCVLIYSPKSGVAEGAYLKEKNHFEQWRWNCIATNVTHWQPLPPKP